MFRSFKIYDFAMLLTNIYDINLIFVCQGEDEADDNEENEDDDGFFVPHGYLSDDEGVEDEDVEGDSGENDEKVQNALSK